MEEYRPVTVGAHVALRSIETHWFKKTKENHWALLKFQVNQMLYRMSEKGKCWIVAWLMFLKR